MAKRKIKQSGSVTVDDIDLDGLSMTDMRFWDQFCPEGTAAVEAQFHWEAGYYDEPNRFFVDVDWKRLDSD